MFRNGVAYGFNAAQDEVRKARQPSAQTAQAAPFRLRRVYYAPMTRRCESHARRPRFLASRAHGA